MESEKGIRRGAFLFVFVSGIESARPPVLFLCFPLLSVSCFSLFRVVCVPLFGSLTLGVRRRPDPAPDVKCRRQVALRVCRGSIVLPMCRGGGFRSVLLLPVVLLNKVRRRRERDDGAATIHKNMPGQEPRGAP